MNKRIATRKPTGAEMRAERDRRLGQTGPKVDASRRAQSIRDGLNKFADAIEEMADAYNREDWKTLDYGSWKDYCEGEFSGARVRLTAEQRRQATASLAAAGLPKRAAAAALGFDEKTVRNDLRGAEKSALPSTEPQVNDSGDAGGEDADVSGQAAADAAMETTATADDGEDPAFRSDDPSAGDGLGGNEPVPGNPLDPRVDSVRDEVVELVAGRPGFQNITEEQAPTSPVEPLLSLSGAGVSLDGDEVEEEPAGQQGSSSTDLASEFMATWRAFIRAFGARDLVVVAPMLTDDEYGELEDDYTFLGQRLAKMRQS